jgi:hypothetical protein
MYDFLFMLIFIILALIYYKLPDNSKENFDATSDMKAVINQVYNADIEAIRNLSSISSQLIAGGLTVPGKLSITGQLKVGSWTIQDNNGHLQFIKDGTQYDNDYGKIPQDTGFIAMAQDGNIWSNRSTGRGWLADNKLNVSGGTINGSLTVNNDLNIGGKLTTRRIDANDVVNINNKLAMNDRPIMIRGENDGNHYIKWSSATDGPEIAGCGGINIVRPCAGGNPLMRIGDWTFSQQNVGICGKGGGNALILTDTATSNGGQPIQFRFSHIGLADCNTGWGWQGMRC